MKLGVVSFLPKEKLFHLKEYLEDVVLGGEKPISEISLDRSGSYLARCSGPCRKEKGTFFGQFEETVKGETD